MTSKVCPSGSHSAAQGRISPAVTVSIFQPVCLAMSLPTGWTGPATSPAKQAYTATEATTIPTMQAPNTLCRMGSSPDTCPA